MTLFAELLSAVVAVIGLAAWLAVHGNPTIALRRRAQPRPPEAK